MNFVPNDLPPLFPNLTGVLAYVLPSIVRLLSGLLAHGAPPAIGVYLGLLAAAPVFLVLAAAYVVALLLAFAAAIAASLISPGAAGGAAFVTGALGLGAAIYAVVRLVRAFAPPRLVVPFDRLPDTARARRHFGAKAVELARALREGELVPPGVAVRSLPESAPPERRAAHARRAARSIVRHFDAARPATGTQSSILYPQSSSLIVRSSFTAEDARDASYAGIFRSVLDVAPEEDAIARAIEDVLASAGGGARARYESAKGTRRQARLAVIVQRQIRETLGGTAASFDISTGRRDARLVEIERGGRATLLLRPSGAVEATAGSIDPATEAESAVQLAAGAATRIAARRGVDVHIEWGYDGALHIYQVREIAGESVLVTLARAEGLGPARALSPLSRDVHFGDRALAAGPLARLSLLDARALTVLDGLFYVDRRALEAATARLRAGRIPPRAWRTLISMLTAPNDAAFPAPKAPQLPANVARLRSLIATQQNAAFRAALWRAAIAAFAGVSEAEVLAALPPLSVALGAGDAFARPAGGDIYELAELAPGNAELQPGPGNAELQLGIPPRNSDSLPDRFDLARRARERQRGASFRWMTHAVGFAIAHEATLRAQIERQHEAIVAAASEVALAARRTGADRGIGDNVFLLTLDELSGRVPPPDAQTIASRRDALDAARRDPPPSVRFFRDGIEVRFARGETIPGARRGIGIGAGVITGTLNNPRDAAPGADAIDLIPDTDVRHLSTLTFSRPILALAGGIAGHLATVARELGVPLFVIDASGGDATFAPGMRVTIDFEKRTVRNA